MCSFSISDCSEDLGAWAVVLAFFLLASTGLDTLHYFFQSLFAKYFGYEQYYLPSHSQCFSGNNCCRIGGESENFEESSLSPEAPMWVKLLYNVVIYQSLFFSIFWPGWLIAGISFYSDSKSGYPNCVCFPLSPQHNTPNTNATHSLT